MVYFGIHIGVEAILARLRHVPAGQRLLLGEANGDNALDALESVLPRYDEPQRRPVLVRQYLAVETHCQDRQGVRCFLYGQAFAVGPVERTPAQPRHLPGVIQRFEGDVLRLRRRLEPLDDFGKRDADPGNDHRPGLDTAHAVDALLEIEWLDKVVEVERAGLLYVPVNRDRPGACFEVLCVAKRIVLAGAELVIVVVGRDVLVTIGLLGRAERALAHIRQLRAVAVGNDGAQRRAGQQARTSNAAGAHKLAAVEVVGLARYL